MTTSVVKLNNFRLSRETRTLQTTTAGISGLPNKARGQDNCKGGTVTYMALHPQSEASHLSLSYFQHDRQARQAKTLKFHTAAARCNAMKSNLRGAGGPGHLQLFKGGGLRRPLQFQVLLLRGGILQTPPLQEPLCAIHAAMRRKAQSCDTDRRHAAYAAHLCKSPPSRNGKHPGRRSGRTYTGPSSRSWTRA